MTQGMEELKELLFCASLELERARANAETQTQIQERILLHLQELLAVTRRERDEAREQLLKLEQSVAEYRNTITNAQQQYLMSSDRSAWPDTDLDVNRSAMYYNTFPQSAHPATLINPVPYNDSSPLVELTDEIFWNSTPVHHFDLQPDVDLHRPPISSSNAYCSNLMELKDQLFYCHNEQRPSLVERQESEQQQEEVESHLLRSPPSIHGGTPAAMPAHLPEPPEADIEVSESALPERGKLLQAVIQAGPLLQTLLMIGPLPQWRNPPPALESLMTGPLPQWRNPPPALDCVEIPRISICSSPNSTIPISPLFHEVSNPHGTADCLQVNSALSSSHLSLRPCTARINNPPTSAFNISGKSGSEAAPGSSKLLFVPVLNSMDCSINDSRPLKFGKRH